ncbi:MAG: MBL fold metallo-hydrolase [Planctomycetaceae bacterium]
MLGKSALDLCRCAAMAAVLSATMNATKSAGDQITENCIVEYGPVNGAVIRSNGQQLAVYGWDDGPVDRLLLTHGRRDVVWRMKGAAETASVTAPVRERYLLESGPEFWAAFPTAKFHDYAQQSTKIPDHRITVDHWVGDGDTIEWNGLVFQVLETPGYTRGSTTYVVELDGKRIGFTGDLIYGDGRIPDLYSFQDAIPDAQIRGYHGYGARLADLVTSLDRIVEARLDIIVPARGPVIQNPEESARRLKQRVQAVYRNYLSTNALHWYFREDRMKLCGERVLGKGADIELMPYSRHEKTPDWIFQNSTSRLLLSENRRGFLLDCGYQRVIDAVQELIDQEVIEKVDGIFVTHFHDDHTDMVQAAAEKFDCPVYATPEYADVLENPDAYHLPALTANPIRHVQRMTNGQSMKWNEFELTFHYFPGQTWYHGALHVRKPDERPVFFIGDAFAPSGFDDYCVQNRNLLHDDEGYLLCLKKIHDAGDCWLVNEHIEYVFDFSDDELSYLEQRYRERRNMLAELFPWDDPNYGVDEQWAVMYPRGVRTKTGDTFRLQVRITNHSPVVRQFRVTPAVPGGLTLMSGEESVTLQPHESGAATVLLRADAANETPHVVTADIESDGMSFRRWADAQITVEP